MKSILLISIVFLAFRPPATGQSRPKRLAAGGKTDSIPAIFHATIRVVAKAYGDSIVVRWAPSNQWAWSMLNKTGYILERIDRGPDGHLRRQRLSAQPIRPLTLDRFKATFGKDDRYAAIAAQSLYGTNFTTNIRQGQSGNFDQANAVVFRFGFGMEAADLDPAVATAMGLRRTDKNVNVGELYGYRLYPAAPLAYGKIDTGGFLLRDSTSNLENKPQLAEVIAGDRHAELHWLRSPIEQYSAFNVERSDDGRHFRQLNAYPLANSTPDSTGIRRSAKRAKQYALLKAKHVFLDSLPLNGHAYYYRVRGIDAFGDWSDYSDTLAVTGVDLTPPSPPIVDKPRYTGGRSFLLHWMKAVREPDFKGWLVARSASVKGPYQALTTSVLPPDQTQFTDTAALRHGPNYYIVIALDTAGNPAVSLPATGILPDTAAPLPPIGLAGRVDRNGLVYLHWKPNREDDLRGYKVYYTNGEHHPLTQVTRFATSDTSYIDSIPLKTLSKYIWYRIVAVDRNNNHSKYSAPLRLKRPDIVPPMPPVAMHSMADADGVLIDWSASPDNDVAGYVIYRRTITAHDSTDWIAYVRFRADTSRRPIRFRDSAVKVFTRYQYYAIAVDEDSLQSARSPLVTAALMTAPPLPPLKTLTAVYDARSGQVNLKWQYAGQGSYCFILYRAAGMGALSRFNTIGQTASGCADRIPADLSPGSRMRYAIQVLFNDGQGRTRISDPVTVTISSSH